VISADRPLDFDVCALLVAGYLRAQGWGLIDPQTLAGQIWQDFGGEAPAGQAAKKAVENQIWQRYAAVLHDCCRQQPGGSPKQAEQAWNELAIWMAHQVRFLNPPNPEPDDLVQEALIELHRRLEREPLRSPRAFFVFALNTLHTKNTDSYRRQAALKRGEAMTDSIEELELSRTREEGGAWDELAQPQGSETRGMENDIADEQIRQQLLEFLRAHIRSPLQLQVAELHFVDSLEPAEIARLLGKQPHEIRLAKARIVQSLRGLPAEERDKLMKIIGRV
jgi:RNA polymerase sigma factor (sigma-70 family)